MKLLNNSGPAIFMYFVIVLFSNLSILYNKKRDVIIVISNNINTLCIYFTLYFFLLILHLLLF